MKHLRTVATKMITRIPFPVFVWGFVISSNRVPVSCLAELVFPLPVSGCASEVSSSQAGSPAGIPLFVSSRDPRPRGARPLFLSTRGMACYLVSLVVLTRLVVMRARRGGKIRDGSLVPEDLLRDWTIAFFVKAPNQKAAERDRPIPGYDTQVV